MINRIKGPKISTDFKIEVPEAKTYQLDNGLKVFEFSATSFPIVKVEYCSKFGRVNEQKPAIARIACRLLREATASKNSNELSEHFDFYGADLGATLGLDNYRLGMSSLKSHFDNVFPTWAEILTNPLFSEKDLEKIKSISAQKLKNQLSKNNVIAYRQFTESIFGKDHLYGYNTEPTQIEKVNLSQVKQYYQENFGIENAAIFVSGHIEERERSLLNKYLGHWHTNAKKMDLKFPFVVDEASKMHIDKGQDQQYSINIGKRLFKRKHEDFTGMFVLNTVLGGYFGSRLMSKIREEKAYTYNIYSSIDAMVHDGYWYIAAEVGSKYVEDTKKEIYNVLKELREELIPNEELLMVKNYLQGHLLGLFDGPFSSSKIMQSAWKFDLDTAEIQSFIRSVQNMDSKTLKTLANKYLSEDNIIELTVGKLPNGV